MGRPSTSLTGGVPLHPTVLSEGALSLLPNQLRRAAVWTIEVDADGKTGATTVKRALVTSVAQLDYEGVQATFDAGKPHPSIEPLADLGRLRLAMRVELGAIELALPEQEVVRDGDDWKVHMRRRTDVDAWNAEISLLTGMAAAELMIDAKVGLLRTLPKPDGGAITTFLRTARSLGITVPDGATPATVLAALDPDQPTAMALMTDATKLLRGAGYTTFDGGGPNETSHAGDRRSVRARHGAAAPAGGPVRHRDLPGDLRQAAGARVGTPGAAVTARDHVDVGSPDRQGRPIVRRCGGELDARGPHR